MTSILKKPTGTVPFMSGLAAFLLSISLFLISCETDHQTVVTEKKQVIETYPFGDENPVPALASAGSRAYPYSLFNRYSRESTEKEWTVVTLENDYIKVDLLPEVGGKVWGAVEKSTGLEFLYKNKVKKFRNIAVRGPWTSGGIEFNFGTAGHTPATATPVDYLIRQHEDGSASVVVGAMDLPSRSEWRVTITVAPDKAYFETESFWYNTTPLRQSSYVWMNAAIRAGDDLRFFFPGTRHIGHPGDVHPWPVDNRQRDLSWYRNNDFGGSKSYHVLGEMTDYFGAYWHDDRFGFGNWSLYPDMPGKKLWIWSLARSGGIWEDLLTDTDGQYVEVQSGRYFSQAGGRSPETPFNHDTFGPFAADRWKEIWFPLKETGGIKAASPHAVLNHNTENGTLFISLMALQPLNDSFVIRERDRLLSEISVDLNPLEVYHDTLEISSGAENLTMTLGNNKLVYRVNRAPFLLDRPLENTLPSDMNTASRIYHRGINHLASRNYAEARQHFLDVIETDPAYTAAYVQLADLGFRRGEYRQALDYAEEALSHNTYDAGANFIYGALLERLGKTIQAIEAFGWAARSPEYRSPAYAEMGRLYLKTGRPDLAIEFANRALQYDHNNIRAYQTLAVAYRNNEKPAKVREILDTLLSLDPLNHFARYERHLLDGEEQTLREFTSLIRNELPHETYLEMAMFYTGTGQNRDAAGVLRHAPSHPMIHYWLAYLLRDDSPQESRRLLAQATDADPGFVFPFRPESLPVLTWADETSPSWKNRYYKGLILWHAGRKQDALELFQQMDDPVDFAPFYISRAELKDRLGEPAGSIYADLKTAHTRSPDEWRTWHSLTTFQLQNGDIEGALETAASAYEEFPEQDAIKMDYARSLLAAGEYEACIRHLGRIRILPFEGAREGREIYEKAHMFRALELLRENRPEIALQHIEHSYEWPETLGVGKPYNPDHRLQIYLEAMIRNRLGEQEQARNLLEEITNYTSRFPGRWGGGHIAGALAFLEAGRFQQGSELLERWQQARPDNLLAEWAVSLYHQDIPRQNELEQSILQNDPTGSGYTTLTIRTIRGSRQL